MARSMKEVHTINYYPINEGAARRAKEMNSFSDYKEGSATAEYRAMVDKAAAIAEQQKSRVDPMYHEKIDHLLDTYARKLAENMNQGFAIDARVPSVMIAGPANFPVGKKEKQNRARDSNMEEWRYIQGRWIRYAVPAWAGSVPMTRQRLKSSRRSWTGWNAPSSL